MFLQQAGSPLLFPETGEDKLITDQERTLDQHAVGGQKASCSSSDMEGSFFDSSSSRYGIPLVLKKPFSGRPLTA